MNENLDFLSENMALLYQIHGEKVAVIKHQSVLGVYDNYKKAEKAAKKTQDAEMFLIQNVFANRDCSKTSVDYADF